LNGWKFSETHLIKLLNHLKNKNHETNGNTKTETQEIDVSFPMFKKHSTCYYWGISEKEWVEIMPNIKGINIIEPYDVAKVLTEGIDITEDEFNEKFIEVFNKIKSYKPQYSVI
jgi:hypothetical protein